MGLWVRLGRFIQSIQYFTAIVTTVIFILAGLSACDNAKIITTTISGSCSSRVSTIYSGPPEPTYCNTTYVHVNPVTVTGTAKFESRPYQASSCVDPNCGLGSIGAAQPVRFAEVAAFDTGGTIVQCGETDNSGNFSIQLPDSTNTYTIKVRSRADNAYVKVSVLNCPEENIPYSITTQVTPSAPGPHSVGIITADAVNTGPMTGAAFNIYSQILKTNEFLQTQLNTCAANFTGCNSFTVAPKVQAYWEKGFNPNEYFNSSSGLSFYMPTYKRLFILGGISGDIYSSDTDHFDNSVIIHEYGHFLEDVYAVSDSPGGSHSGNSPIDPRLAWSEGWGNFIQAAARDEAKYRDTIGTPNAANPIAISDYIFDIPVETSTGGTVGACVVGSSTSGCDIPEFNYEGNFREFAITRSLWDIFDSGANADSTGDEAINNKMQELWSAITSTHGLLNPAAAFRTIGLVHYAQANRNLGPTATSDWSAIYTLHKQGDYTEYARYTDNTGGCGKAFTLNPLDNYPDDNGTFATSHLVRNNDFLHYYHAGGAVTFTLKALTTDLSGGYISELEPDMDLYLYNSSGRFGNSSDIISSAAHYWDNSPATEQTETITLSNLAAGNYLLNVKIYTGKYKIDNNASTNNCIGTGFRRICENDANPYLPAGDQIDYELQANGVNICPASLP